jgi:hypothetical protein
MQNKPFKLEDAETEAKDLLKKMEDNSKSLEKTASLIIKRVNNDDEKICNYKEELRTVKTDYHEKIHNYKEILRTIKTNFKSYFVAIFVLIVPVIIQIVNSVLGTNVFSSSNSSNISLPSSIMHNFHMYQNLFWYTFFVLIFSLILFYYTYQKKICTTDSSELNDEKDDTDDGEIDSRSLTSSSQIRNVKTDFDKSKDILLSIASSVGDSVPIINNLYKSTTRLGEHKQLVEKYKQSLKYYNVIVDDSFFQEIGDFVPAHNIIVDNEEDREKYINSQIYSHCVQKRIEVSENILLLLYNEHNGKTCKDTFREIKESKIEVEKLAEVLIKSQKIIDPPNNYEYNKEDISAIIKKIHSFSLSRINGMLTDSFFVLSYLDSYIEFLKKNEIDTQSYTPSIKFLIDNSGNKKVQLVDIVIPLAYKIGLNIFNKDSRLNNDKSLIEGFARASVTLKFHDDIPLREIACQYSANDHAVAVLRSYQQKMKENGGQQVVLIGQLIEEKEMVTSFSKMSKDKEGTYFHDQLTKGKWYDTSFALLLAFIQDSRDDIIEKISNIEKYEMLKKAVRSAFEKVKLTTIEKSIDAQLFGAYIIMFYGRDAERKTKKKNNDETDNIDSDSNNTDEAGLQAIIDKLSKRDLKWNINETRIEEIKKEYEYKICPKYDFVNLTPSTRIGILDPGQSFSDFQHDFLNDIKIMLKIKKHEQFKIGLIVQKIMPSGDSLGFIDDEDLPANIQIKDYDVVKYLAKLASTRIPVTDQISVMRFENNINLIEIINEYTFYEIIKDGYDDLTEETENEILNSRELKKSLLDELNKVGFKEFMSIGLNLRRGNLKGATKDKIEEIIQSVLEKKYSANKKLKGKAKVRSEILSSRFMDSVETLAILYD